MHTCVRQCIFDQYVRLIVCFSFHYFRILLAKILQSLTGVQPRGLATGKCLLYFCRFRKITYRKHYYVQQKISTFRHSCCKLASDKFSGPRMEVRRSWIWGWISLISNFGRNYDFIYSFWNCLTFRSSLEQLDQPKKSAWFFSSIG